MTWAAAVLVGAFSAPPSPEAVRGAVEAIRQDSTFQKALPTREVPEPPSSWSFGPLAQAVLWMLVVVAILALVVLLVRSLQERRRARDVELAGAPGPDPARPVPAVAFEDADRLAREGRYAEAIHVLLLRTLAALAAQGRGLAASLTSREIVREAPLTGEARGALAGLVDSVEVSRFGSVVPDAAEYAACRLRFERLAAPPRATAGAA